MNLEELGITKEHIFDRLVEKLAADVMVATNKDEDGYPWQGASEFAQQLNKAVAEAICAKVAAVADEHVAPQVSELVEGVTLQATNKWGEAKGQSLTFREYLVDRAERYMTEKVDYNGKTKGESGGFSWTGTQTRVTHLVNKHLHYSISTAMEGALKSANSRIVTGLEETVKMKLAEIANSLKVAVSTK